MFISKERQPDRLKGEKMKFTANEKSNGEMAVRLLSEKAKNIYNNTDPLNVYEYEDQEGNKAYAYDGCLGECSGLSLEELDSDLSCMFDEING